MVVPRRLLALAGVAVAAGALGTWGLLGSDDARAEAPPETTAAPTTTTTVPAPTTTTAAPPSSTTTTSSLPVPQPPPEDPRADVPVVEIGRMRIPAIGLDHPVYEGVWLTVIDQGPGHWPGSAAPGGWGNAVFAGHRVTHSHPFREIDRVRPGDEISFALADGSVHVYAVTEQFVVSPDELWIVDQAPGRTLTLFACHPRGSARQRIVTRAEVVSSENLAA